MIFGVFIFGEFCRVINYYYIIIYFSYCTIHDFAGNRSCSQFNYLPNAYLNIYRFTAFWPPLCDIYYIIKYYIIRLIFAWCDVNNKCMSALKNILVLQCVISFGRRNIIIGLGPSSTTIKHNIYNIYIYYRTCVCVKQMTDIYIYIYRFRSRGSCQEVLNRVYYIPTYLYIDETQPLYKIKDSKRPTLVLTEAADNRFPYKYTFIVICIYI